MSKKKIHYGYPIKETKVWTGAMCGTNGEFITDVRDRVTCKKCIHTFTTMSTLGLFKPQ